MKKLWMNALLALLAIGMVVALYLVFIWVPPIKAKEATEQIAQRIFYFHVPSAWLGFLAFFIVFVSGIMYLWTKERRYELLGAAAAEVGVVFITLVLITGPIWAKPVWGIWWTWDTRLTSSLVLWMVYLAYLFLRRYMPEGKRRANLAAVVGIVGFIDVPIVYFSIRWWETQHPKPVIASSEGHLASPMLFTLLFSLAIFTILFIVLLRKTYRLALMQDVIDKAYKEWELDS